MTIRELMNILRDYDVDVNVKTAKDESWEEAEINDIDVWSINFFTEDD